MRAHSAAPVSGITGRGKIIEGDSRSIAAICRSCRLIHRQHACPRCAHVHTSRETPPEFIAPAWRRIV